MRGRRVAGPYRFEFSLGFDATAHACAFDFERKETVGTGVPARAAAALLQDRECSDEDPRWYDALGSDEYLVSIEVRDDEDIVDGGFGPTGGAFPT
jgi:hypothetical protein